MVVYDEIEDSRAKIKVVGVGGAGGNAVKRMIKNQMDGVEFITVNTDAQALNKNDSSIKIQIGREVTRGLGAGARPQVGRNAANESKDAIMQAIEGADMVFITAGMGGGTGTGASPVVAELAKKSGALTVGIVTKPFTFEGRNRMRNADDGIEELRKYVDTLIVIQNQKLLSIVGEDATIEEAFFQADTILNQATSGISNIITQNGLVNVDFADVKTIMENMGDAIMGIGTASGPSRAVMAASLAIASPILDDVSIKGAKGVLINFTGGSNMKLSELTEAAEIVHNAAGDDANIIFGTVIDPNLTDEIRITVIATGFNEASIRPENRENAIAETPVKHVAATSESPKPVVKSNYQPNQPVYNDGSMSTPTWVRQKEETIKPQPPQFLASSQGSSAPTMTFGEEDMEKPAYFRHQRGFFK